MRTTERSFAVSAAQDDSRCGAVEICSEPVNSSEENAWREQCRQQLERDVMTRIKYGFCHVHKPVLDDAPVRVFATMTEYRTWCERNLPAYLGYRRAS